MLVVLLDLLDLTDGVCVCGPVMHLFLLSMKMQSPVVLDNISQPCLEILYHIIKPEAPTSKKHKVYSTV